MRLFDVIGRMLLGSAIRRTLWRSPRLWLIVAAVAGLALMSIGTARAGTFGCNANQNPMCVREAAKSACESHLPTLPDYLSPGRCSQNGSMFVVLNKGGNEVGPVPTGRYFFRGTCPPDAPWDEATKQCLSQCPPGSQRMANGECSPTSEECEQRNGDGFGVQASKPFQSRCVAGCMLTMTAGTGSCSKISVSSHDVGHTVCNGEFSWSGATCSAQPPNEPYVPGPDTVDAARENKPQECIPASANQTMCVKSNGDHCYTSSAGKQTCWKPTETGTKTDQNVAQVRNAGTDAVPPNPQLPSGDTLQKSGESVTTTTTRGNGSGSGNRTTTTVTNYTTVHGTNAGPKNQGQRADGTGKEEDEEKGTASGGADCESKPIVSDPMLEMVATQAWATRCAVEAGNAVKVTGDVGDCASPFDVEGEDANAVKLRAMRAQICGENQPEWTKVQGDGSEGAPDAPEDESAWKKTIAVSTSRIDLSGFGLSRSCPRLGTLELGWLGTYSLDTQPWFCDFVIVAGGVILFIAAWQAVIILARG